jgi:hypothetical protein
LKPIVSLCLFLLLLTGLSGCTTSPPGDVNNICSIFQEKDDWYDDAADSRDRWGSGIPTMMAIIHQESRFRADAKPPRKKLLGFIPGPRASSAYGYSQAKSSTWGDYKDDGGHFSADRDEFSDAIDFVGWYNKKSQIRSGISPQDTYGLYLAYHEGHGGYNRGTYRQKEWLMQVAQKVSVRAGRYQTQLSQCEEELKSGGGLFGWF